MKKKTINKYNENGLNITLNSNHLSKKDKLINAISNIIIATIVYIAITLTFISLFKIEGVTYIPILMGFVVILFFGYYFEYIKKPSLLLMIPLLIILVYLFVQIDYIKNGLFLVMNQIANVIGTNTGYIMKKYDGDISEELFKNSIISFSIIFSVIMAYISIVSIRNNSKILLWLIIIPIYLFQAFTGIMPSFIYNVILLIVSMIIISNSFSKKTNDNRLNTHRNSIALYTSLFFIIFIIASSLLITAIFPTDNYTKSSNTVDLKGNITNKIEDYRYETEKTNSFTQGDFSKLGELELSEREALEIDMEESVSLYLKGYIGSKYTPKGWIGLDDKTYYDSYSLFYWLDQSKFNAMSQLSVAEEMIRDDSKNNNTINLTINNINANSKYMYIPYELDFNSSNLDDIKNPSDGKLVSNKFKGSRKYSFKSNKNLVTKYPQLIGNIYSMKDKDELKEYIQSESYYNEFVYENYTQLPMEAEELLRVQIGKVINNSDSHMPYEIAIEEVKSYLKENVEYVEDPDIVPKDEDFLKFFLKDSKEGYSAHFASAGTAIFRYLGIPSRYVEGYLITPENIEDAPASEPIVVRGEDAHAWSEIYIDQLGWIPIELTPPYEDIMDPIDMSNYPGSGNLDNESYIDLDSRFEEGKQEVVDDEEIQSNRPKDKPKKKLITFENIIILLLVLLFLIILIYIIYIIKNRRRLKILQKEFKDSNHKIAVHKIFSYSMNLMHYNGILERGGSIYSYIGDIKDKYSDRYAEIFEKAVEINQKALYSNQKISEEDYQFMTKFKNQILYNLIGSKNILQRIKMKLWDFVY